MDLLSIHVKSYSRGRKNILQENTKYNLYDLSKWLK